MKIDEFNRGPCSGLFLTVIVCFLSLSSVFAQTEKLGQVSYTPVKGWTKTVKENIVTFSEVNEAAGKFCIITLYGATPGTGKPQSDFVREWNDLVVKTFGASDMPKTETGTIDGWTTTAGGGAVDFNGNKAAAILTVLSGFGRTVSVLGIFNDESYMARLAAFGESIDVEKTAAVNPATPRQESVPTAPPPTAAPMHAATLVKEFENNEVRANQTWIGKRVRVYGTVNSIEINRADQIVLTFKSSITTSHQARCYFNKSQSARVAPINAHVEATVEGTVKGLGDGFDNSKAYLVLENCTVP